MATSAPGASAQPDPPTQSGDGAAREGRLNRRATIWAAVITAVAAIVGTLLGLYLSRSPGPGGLQLGISSVSPAMVNGVRVIEVTGTVGNLPADEYVYAFAGRQANSPPWYPGGPAAISGSGQWVAEIADLPASAADLSVWAGVASQPALGAAVPTVGPSSPGSVSPTVGPSSPGSVGSIIPQLIEEQLQQLAAEGPRAAGLVRVTPARHVALPRS